MKVRILKSLNTWFLTIWDQFDLPADSGHFVPGQAAHRHGVLQMTKHDLALQVVVLVNMGVHCDFCWIDSEGHPQGRVIGTSRKEQRKISQY